LQPLKKPFSLAIVILILLLFIRMKKALPLMQGEILHEPVIQAIADRAGKSVAQIVLRWQLQSGWATIPKSIQAKRIQSNAEIFDFSLNDTDMAAISALDQHRRVGPDPDNFDF
jgi:diketogulonate reductase-like aldo/keto reductase